ncbi:intermembrane transport protein PqiB [Rubellicoccus peritrichatus]|uniref:MlaD family protein n=1 Tax=Rubellicoccus peritrichatus TaxID=3080537 RepID=A0AAQ3QWT1_9BACT|nr:MlaD family protein [Puniceicoccus sp. CR14]WOO42165.1 MlaD family protein [Puniceicoccus sp. CR14]
MNQEKSQSSEEFPDVVIVKHHRFSIVWVVPVIALLVAGWLIYNTYTKKGKDITITFKDGSGLVAGKTELQYLGVQVGIVNEVNLSNLTDVVVKARLDKSASELASEGTAFWVVRPEISLAGVRGLDTLLSGPYITMIPGKSKTPQYNFTGLPGQPAAGPNEPGLNIVLQAEQLGSLKDGDPIYYREFKVGEIDQVSIASDAKTVHVHAHIMHDYENLIRENTKFWNASGIGMSLGLFGAKIKTESLESILSGGVSFATPPNDEMGNNVVDGTVFKLHNDPEDEWSKWSPTISLPDTVEVSTPQANQPTSKSNSEDPNNKTVDQPAGEKETKPEAEPSVKLKGPPAHR